MSATVRSGHVVPNLLRAAYPKHTTKRAATAANVPNETARNWLRGRAVPSASTLLNMAERCDALANALQRLLDDRRSPSPNHCLPSMARERAAADRGDAQ